MRRVLAVFGILLLIVGGPVLAGEPTDEEKRAEAHRTVLRRFSGEANTAEIGLSKAAAAFVDLFLDVQRNIRAVRTRTAPRSTMFMGNAHPQVKVEDGELLYQAAFVNFVIDEVRVPIPDLLPVLAAALDAKALAPAAIETDAESDFTAWRWQLVSLLATQCDEALGGDDRTKEEWRKLRPTLGPGLAAALDTIEVREAFPVLQALMRVGGEDAAKALMAKIEGLPEGSPPYVKPMYARAACGMDCETSRVYRRKMLASGETSLAAAALGSISGDLDDETFGLVEKLLDPEAEVEDQIWQAALRAFEGIGDERSVAAIRKLFEGARKESAKIGAGIALLRLGHDEPVEWLEEKLVELKARTDPRGRWAARAVERALEQTRSRR
jgi:hypothetical protein